MDCSGTNTTMNMHVEGYGIGYGLLWYQHYMNMHVEGYGIGYGLLWYQHYNEHACGRVELGMDCSGTNTTMNMHVDWV